MSQKSEEEGWQGFLNICLAAKNREELKELLWLFLTPEEQKDIATRYLIVQELVRGEKTQREIAKDLDVSIAKITRGSNFLKMAGTKLRKLLSSKA